MVGIVASKAGQSRFLPHIHQRRLDATVHLLPTTVPEEMQLQDWCKVSFICKAGLYRYTLLYRYTVSDMLLYTGIFAICGIKVYFEELVYPLKRYICAAECTVRGNGPLAANST
jgi:hypothetical protein